MFRLAMPCSPAQRRSRNDVYRQALPIIPGMYASTFIFRAGQFDEEFHRLDQLIAESARAIPGYLGEETWENPDAGLIQNIYYWESEEALQQLISHPVHLEAKSKQSRWLDGYRVVISKVLRQYGDGGVGPPNTFLRPDRRHTAMRSMGQLPWLNRPRDCEEGRARSGLRDRNRRV